MSDSVTRYVVTHVNREGLRTLSLGCQGRWTYATREEAQAQLDAMLANNERSALEGLYGNVSQIEVRPCECWPDHFDPKGIYFDE